MNFKDVHRFLKEYSIDPKNFLFHDINESKNIIIDLPNEEVREYDVNENGIDNFELENGRSVNITNWSPRQPSGKIFFYNRFFPIVNSAWSTLVIKADEHLFIKLNKGMVYEWDDCK